MQYEMCLLPGAALISKDHALPRWQLLVAESKWVLNPIKNESCNTSSSTSSSSLVTSVLFLDFPPNCNEMLCANGPEHNSAD